MSIRLPFPNSNHFVALKFPVKRINSDYDDVLIIEIKTVLTN